MAIPIRTLHALLAKAALLRGRHRQLQSAEEYPAKVLCTARERSEEIVTAPNRKPMTAEELKRLNDWLELDFLPQFSTIEPESARVPASGHDRRD
ncbi:hypothetical protein [Burkholderia sp. THE68]|uniref:hypothetical protein n=1 Tax=Burkholderia sp. THE68 TaxID=758782 RepID=UPI00138964CA|nr:hypothetical protein [Burkholderia sp. THE68]